MQNTISVGQSIISKKKEQFRKKRRTQHLQTYMKKARIDFIKSVELNQYLELKNIIDHLFAQDVNEQQREKKNEQIKRCKVLELIEFANKGSTVAIISLSELILNRIITIENIQNYHSQKNPQSDREQRRQLTQIISFPQKDNEGWIIFIRVLIKMGYCTEKMIRFCLYAIARTRSQYALNLSLEVLFVLVFQKKILSMEEIFNFTTQKTSQIANQWLLRTQELIYSFMKHSLDNNFAEESSNIRFYSTKLLMKSFQTQSILQGVILKLIPLERISTYINDKFQIKSFYDKNKALKILSALLICLTNYDHYEPEHVISVISMPIMKILHYVKKLSFDLDITYSLIEGNQNFNCKKSEMRKNDENFQFLQEAIFMIEILIDKYLFCVQSFDLIISSLEAFILEVIFVHLHSAYHREIKKVVKDEFDYQRNYGMTEKQMLECLLVQKIKELTRKVISNLILISDEIRKGNLNTTSENIERFLLVRNLIISRFRKSQLEPIVEREVYESGIDLNYL